MTIDEKERLALLGDASKTATGIRVRAARISTGMGSDAIAKHMGEGMTKQKIRNAEAGANYPGVELMRYLWRQHRIDMTFILHGDFAQLAGDVQERLFAALAAVHSERDQGRNSTDGAPLAH